MKYVLLICMHVIEFHINDIGWNIVDFFKNFPNLALYL